MCGADVLKVERPGGGDPLRALDPFGFADLNLGKRSIALDLRSARERVLSLVRDADVVVESFRPGTLARLGLGWDELRAANRAVVLTSISNFGQTGPYRDLDATEIVLYAMGHEMYGTGQPDREPMSMAPGLNLCFAGQTAAVATVACLLGGGPEWIDVSIMETFLASIDRRADSLVAYAYCGEKMVRLASLGLRDVPPQYNRCRDGWFHLGASARDWGRLAAVAGEDAEPEDRAAFLSRWAAWCAERGKQEIVEALQAAGVPAAPVNSVADLVSDAHLAAREFFVDVGGRTHVGPFARFTGTPVTPPRPAPALGDADGFCGRKVTVPGTGPVPKGQLPLEGVRVLDLGVVLAGPYGTLLLADLGAEVIRVESTRHFVPMTRGAMARPPRELVAAWPPISGGYPDRDPGERPWNRFPWFNQTARNKLGVTIDLREPGGRDAFLRLVAESDVLVTNQSPGSLDALGAGWDACRAVNDRLVYVDATSFGSTGPYRSWRALGLQMEAFAGHDLLRRYRDLDVDSNTWAVTADAAGALAIALASCAALYARRRTGRGQYVDISMVENFLGLIGPIVHEHTATGRVPEPLGNRARTGVQGCYPCAGDDRWLVLTLRDDADWEGFARATGIDRAEHDELDERIAAWTRERRREEAVALLRAHGVPAGPVLDDADAYADPHLPERGFFWEITQADTGTHLYPGAPYKLATRELGARLPPVRLGEHNEHVWRTIIGVSEDEYRDLEARGAIGTEYD